MGQQNSLNCRSSQKKQQYQIQTTHSNALNLYRKQKEEKLQSELKSTSKKSMANKTQVQTISDLKTTSNVTNQKNNAALIPQHQNILKVSYSPFSQSEKIENKYVEKMGKTLSEVIQPRYNSTMHLPQAQIVILIQSLVYGLAYMQKYDYKHHDFYPSNIFYNNGIFKIISPLMLDCSGYSLTQQRKRFSFLSPQLIAQILQQTNQTQIPEEMMIKSDIFSIGMIVLQCCTLLPSAECYDQENYSIIDRVIKERLVKTSKLYSPVVADCIAQMLRYQVNQRISASQLAILVFLNSSQEKAAKETQQVVAKPVANMPPPQNVVLNQPPHQIRQPYMQNPPHVQQQFLVLPPGHLPPNQMMNMPTVQQILPLNDNNIALPTPNYAYSRIGPNNQGLLSPTTLQNKLKVIQLIHEKPTQQEQSDAFPSGIKMHSTLSNNNNVNHVITQQPVQQQMQQQLQQVQQQAQQQAQIQAKQQVQQQTHQQAQQQVIHQTKYQQPRINHSNFSTAIQINHYSSPTQLRYEEENYKYSISQPQILQDKRTTSYYDEYRGSQKNISQYTYAQPSQTVNNYMISNRFKKKDQNGETLEQRVQRILQMSRDIR